MGARSKPQGVIKDTKHGTPRDNLTLDAMDAEQAGMSYGQYKALHPNTAFANEQRLQDMNKPKQQRIVTRAVYEKICPVCGKKFTCHNRSRLYCSDRCKEIKTWNASKKTKEA